MRVNFQKLTDYLNGLAAQGVPGCEMAVWIAHEPVYRHHAGIAKGGETYRLYSATKVLTATVVLRLIEEGALRLSDPVSDYLPEYADLTVEENGASRPAATQMTLEHLLSMQGGLDYDEDAPAIRALIRETNGLADTVAVARRFAAKPLRFDPGLGFRYSLCIDAAAAVAVAATGKPLSALARELVLDPLGITDLSFHPTAGQLRRLAPQFILDAEGRVVPAPECQDRLACLPNYESGGGGLTGSVDGYMPLADALANGGVGANGARVLSEASIDDMRRDRQTGPALADWLRVKHKRGYGYGLGVRTLTDASASLSPPGEFGWDGAAGAWVMMDPDHRIAAFYAQHVVNMNRAYYEFHPAIRDLIYEGLNA